MRRPIRYIIINIIIFTHRYIRMHICTRTYARKESILHTVINCFSFRIFGNAETKKMRELNGSKRTKRIVTAWPKCGNSKALSLDIIRIYIVTYITHTCILHTLFLRLRAYRVRLCGNSIRRFFFCKVFKLDRPMFRLFVVDRFGGFVNSAEKPHTFGRVPSIRGSPGR